MTPTILALLLAAGLPVPPQASQLPPWYRWLFEAFRPAGGGSGTILTVTGISPLALVNALAGPLHSLTQYGKCVQDGTPTPSAPVDILCNNGALRYGKPITIDSARISAYINENGYWLNASDSYSIAVPVEVGTKVAIRFTTTDSSEVATIYRYGFRDSATPDWSSSPTKPLSQVYRGSPQAREYVELTADMPYLIIQLSNSRAATIISSGYLVVSEQTVYPVGTPEVLTVSGKNLFDVSTETQGYYIAADGTITGNAASAYSALIPCKPNMEYTFSGIARTAYGNKRIHAYDANGNWISQISYASSVPPNEAFSATGTTPATASYLRISYSFADTDKQLEQSSTATAYEPYVTPQTVTGIPILLGVGDYKDEAELINGIKTGKVGVKVFDGTEDWIAYTSSTLVVQNATSDWGAVAGVGGYCTHLTVLKAGETPFAGACRFARAFNVYEYKTAFGVADVAGFKAKLASEYAAGTPVILVFPLATETTEQTTAHSLHSYNGTTIVTAQTNVDPVTLRVEYKGVVT